ncbi:hypothetical protein BAUCODRAFT_145825 [Baudoinia panamericana UAMH 10762]|uniref:BZIP domain-containing protein n=1 Tax=Baudoinia panamericana (strain UAMH 10762) TaxID=717646 RepID=M2MPW0_BAUPA|nr:uncharacterized protein BAUCODRAFT_145825 [Baudoinia panamericana UAMH 10762]EMC98801.1 hypothetical protein BAUCODRAFT_145825 [Baudoinia panamericana UAMH 10762]
MNADTSPGSQGLDFQASTSHEYASSDSDSRRQAEGSGRKKRASRAGTRSVTTLSAAQLERKRANDREAQRAIRQRTKDHIETLEKSISDLRGTQESNERLVTATHQRNRELEEENAYLRSRLAEAGYASALPHEGARQPAPPLATNTATQSTSPLMHNPAMSSAMHRASSLSTPSSLSVSTGQSSSSRHGSFQQSSAYSAGAPGSNHPAVGASPMAAGLSAWRSHDGTVSVHGAASQFPQLPEPMQQSPASMYSQSTPTAPSYQYGPSQGQSRQQPYEPIPPPLNNPTTATHSYPPPPASAYGPPQPAAPSTHYHSLQTQGSVSLPSRYPSVTAATGAGYPAAQPQLYPESPQAPGQTYQQPQNYAQSHQPSTAFQPPASYQGTSTQGQHALPSYSAPYPAMQPPPLPATGSQANISGQQYVPQQQQPPQPQTPLPYRENASEGPYSLSHYPSG